jgi:hypothetical protein
MDKTFNARKLVELYVGAIILDPLDCSDNEVSHFGEDGLGGLGRHYLNSF